jgi:hypothetical protein
MLFYKAGVEDETLAGAEDREGAVSTQQQQQGWQG